MSWLFSQALVEEYLAANSLDGEQSAPLNGKPIQQAYCAPDKMMDFSRLSRFGMTFKPLTDILGKELSMSSVVAFHVKTLVPQEKAQELMENDQECGEKWRASFTKYDPDTRSWKTHQCSLLGDLDEFLETWPQWGLMRDGECWEQEMLEEFISENEFGLQLPTTGANEGKGSSKKRYRNSPHFRGAKTSEALRTCETDPIYLNPLFAELIMMWPLGWTDLKRLEMDKFHCVQQQHGEYLQKDN
jgi:hypothetical protein